MDPRFPMMPPHTIFCTFVVYRSSFMWISSKLPACPRSPTALDCSLWITNWCLTHTHTHTHTHTQSVSCLMQYHQGRLEQLWDLHLILTSRQPNSQSNYHFNPYIKHSLMSNIFLPHTATKNTHTTTHTHTHIYTHNSTQLILLHSSSLQFL